MNDHLSVSQTLAYVAANTIFFTTPVVLSMVPNYVTRLWIIFEGVNAMVRTMSDGFR